MRQSAFCFPIGNPFPLKSLTDYGTMTEIQLKGTVELNRLKQVPFVSTALVIVNVIVYILCIVTRGALYDAGVLDSWSVMYQKEYGRILWAMFFHADSAHLFNNMLILFFLGAMLEREIGHIRFGVFYFLSGIGGNVLSLAMKVIHNDAAGSLGASGAIFGLDGVLLAMVILSDRRMESVTPVRVLLMVALSLYSGFTGGNIDNAAHVGGLIVGFLAGGIMCMVQNRKDAGK